MGPTQNVEQLAVADGSSGANGVMVVPDSDVMEPAASTITCHDVNYVVEVKSKPCAAPVTKTILRNVTGEFKPGMNAILGPTGSGKTSLLDVIAGRKDPRGLSGNVLVDGNRQPDNFKCMTGYVVQDDVVMGTLTIRENIMFSANLRLPSFMSKKDKQVRVSNLLQELGLSHCADSKVGNEYIRGISGGERKRTNLGMELVISPPVLFLDEPTTGLDASTANAMMLLLHRLARRGRTIVFSIHQPRYSIFKLFDNLLLLALGRTVYHGPSSDALEYFSSIGFECEEHNNPPDFFLDVINGDSSSLLEPDNTAMITSNETSNVSIVMENPDDEEPVKKEETLAKSLGDKYLKSRWYEKLRQDVDPIEEKFIDRYQSGMDTVVKRGQYVTSFCTQFNYVSRRAVLNIIRNPQTSFVQFFITAVFAAIVGLIYLQIGNMMPSAIQNRVGAMFFIIMNQIFSNLSSIELFIKERAIFIHENSSGFYRVSAYFCAKVICDIVPLRVIPVFVFSVISYFMIGFQNDVGKFFFYFLNLFLTTAAASGIGFLMSASFRVFAIANLMSALTFVLMMVFSGLLVNLDTMAAWLSWLQYLSIFRYSLNALNINEMKDLILCRDIVIFTNETIKVCDNTTGNAYLADQGIKYETTWDLWVNPFAMFVIGLGFMIFSWIRLVCLNKLK